MGKYKIKNTERNEKNSLLAVFDNNNNFFCLLVIFPLETTRFSIFFILFCVSLQWEFFMDVNNDDYFTVGEEF